jgi:hypothetical protein
MVLAYTQRGNPRCGGETTAPSPLPRVGIRITNCPGSRHGESTEQSPPKASTEKGSAGHGCESSVGRGRSECGAVEEASVTMCGRCQSVDGPCRVASLYGAEASRHPGGDGTYACCAIRVGALKARVGRETGSARSVSANAAEVTVVVRRHGYQRGESFEGCECADGNACVRPGDLRVEGPLRDRNTANLVRQWDATSPCPTARLKPSRWCETTRAAPASQACGARVGGWKLQRERGPQSVRRRQGIHAEESHGRRMATSRLPRRTLRVRARSGGSMRCFTERRVCPTSKNLEVQRSNAKRTWRT